MGFKTAEVTLSAAKATNATITVSYPDGTSAGTFADTHAHKMWSAGHQKMYTAPSDFTVSFGASDITVTYLGSTTLPISSRVNFQFDVLGADGGEIEKVVLPSNVIEAGHYLLNLGSPDADDDNGVAASQTVTGAGTAFVLDGALVVNGVAVMDVPRNIVAAWSNAAVLTITGTDVDGNAVVEKSASGTSHTGKKAFKTVTGVTTSATVTGATVGTGDVLGLPVFLPDTSHVVGEFEDGVNTMKPTKVYVMDHMLEAAVDAATSLELVSPVAGIITKVTTIARGTITTGGAITVEVNTTAVDGLSVVVADGAVAGEVDSDTPTAGHASRAVAVGDRIEVLPAAGFNASADIFVIVEIEPTALAGTLVAGVTSAATATTGDTRGTYAPATDPDGSVAFGLLAVLPDPAGTGVAQYTG